MCKKVLGITLALVLTLISVGVFTLHYLYRPLSSGTIYLKNASGEAEILRETERSIPHVFANSEKMAVFT
jgi:hypothetical protein